MSKKNIMNLADAYAATVADTPQMPTLLERKLAVVKIEAARAALESALEQQAEPVAWVCMKGENHDIDFDQSEIDVIPVGTFLYTAQPVQDQELVGEVVEVNNDGFRCEFNRRLAVGTKLYIAPPPPVQEPLTYDEIEAIGDKVANEQLVGPVSNFRVRFARAIEAKLKEKNYD